MIRFPQAKINLGLNVVGERADGFHDIESVLVPVPLRDALEVVVDPKGDAGALVMTRSGLPVAGDVTTDLCWRAVQAVAVLRPLPGLRMHLHKAIPIGAGLGGGSSDGATTLLLLNELLALGLVPDELHRLAAGLGSDCPFFLEDRPRLAEGRGERLSPVDLDLRGLWCVLVNPGIHVPTVEAYRLVRPTGRSMDLRQALTGHPPEQWADLVHNTMEPGVFDRWPVIGAVKDTLIEHGATYAAMSGSGSSVFGIFRNEPPTIAWPADHTATRWRW